MNSLKNVLLFTTFTVGLLFDVAVAKQLPEVDVEPNNESVRIAFEEVFVNAGLPHFIPIAVCESGMEHYEGNRLKKNPNSNARGILQLMTSAHPDPARIWQYNQKYGTSYHAQDFDLYDPEQYLQYALLLALVRGTRDWEPCL